MRLSYVIASGFRGYRDQVRIDFAPGFTIIDGRNGVGKSTVFDAIEFALTGGLSKYKDAKAAGQTVADYLWWTGSQPTEGERFVEVGFTSDAGEITVRRSQLDDPNMPTGETLTQALVDLELAPSQPLHQLCATTIIRDEHIAALSLDLKETERYALLREAIGASDAELWIARAAEIHTQSKKRSETVRNEVTSLTSEASSAARRMDELRTLLVSEDVLAGATARLRVFAATEAAPEALSGPVRERIAAIELELETIERLLSQQPAMVQAQGRMAELEAAVLVAEIAETAASERQTFLQSDPLDAPAGEIAARARNLMALIHHGRQLGLVEHHCPLCSAAHSDDSFAHGIEQAEVAVTRIDKLAADLARRENDARIAAGALADATRDVTLARKRLAEVRSTVEGFKAANLVLGLMPETIDIDGRSRAADLRASLETAARDLRVLDTLKLNADLARTAAAEQDALARLARSQERAGKARAAEATAAALYDAARRAAAETLDLRLDRVLPLMSELYLRLKPHPVWRDIEYSIRGDVRRFLSLQVGEGLNPQFLFSSGQRRATGLAFLLSVNLSLAWSKWRSVLLDDPVQHVDDFRTVHLAEVMAHMVDDGRQVICAVEDPALADMICRRLPVRDAAFGRRITLGAGEDGSLGVRNVAELLPLASRVLTVPPQAQAG